MQGSDFGEFVDCSRMRGSFSSGAGVLEGHHQELSDETNNVPNRSQEGGDKENNQHGGGGRYGVFQDNEPT